jgi:IS30 family transposase
MYLVFDDESMRVSHQTIYRSLFMQARGVLKKGADGPSAVEAAHAPLAPCQRPRTITGADRRCPLDPGKARAIPGHGEGDLLSGAKHSYIATQVERHSRFVILIKLPSRVTAVVLAGLLKHIRKLPATLRRSLTWDRGLEMAKHKDFTVATDVKAYVCDPQSPRQRGTKENVNLLLRQYFPRGTDLSPIFLAQLDQVSLRGRLKLEFDFAAEAHGSVWTSSAGILT